MKKKGPALNEVQQKLVMEFYALTKGRGHHYQIKVSKKLSGRSAKIQALKLAMVKAGVPGEIIYGDKPAESIRPSSWVRSA